MILRQPRILLSLPGDSRRRRRRMKCSAFRASSGGPWSPGSLNFIPCAPLRQRFVSGDARFHADLDREKSVSLRLGQAMTDHFSICGRKACFMLNQEPALEVRVVECRTGNERESYK